MTIALSLMVFAALLYGIIKLMAWCFPSAKSGPDMHHPFTHDTGP